MDEHISPSELPQGDHREAAVTSVNPAPRFPLFPSNLLLLALSRFYGSGQKIPLRFELLYRALRLSTSYRVAHKVTKRAIREEDVKIRDFDIVKSVYADFGSVYDISFSEWYIRVRPLFDLPVNGNVTELFRFPVDTAATADDLEKAHGRLEDYLKAGRLTGGDPKVAILGVPLVGDKNTVKKAILQAIDKMFDKPLETRSAKYSFRPRYYENVVRDALDAIEERVRNGAITLPALLNEDYGDGTRKYKRNLSPKEKESRAYATKIMLRRLERAVMTAENAARGDFLVTQWIEGRDYQDFERKELVRISDQNAEMRREMKEALIDMAIADSDWQSYLGPNFRP